jgi:hypothetical protein
MIMSISHSISGMKCGGQISLYLSLFLFLFLSLASISRLRQSRNANALVIPITFNKQEFVKTSTYTAHSIRPTPNPQATKTCLTTGFFFLALLHRLSTRRNKNSVTAATVMEAMEFLVVKAPFSLHRLLGRELELEPLLLLPPRRGAMFPQAIGDCD